MRKIYWLTGYPWEGKLIVANKLFEFIKTERRNWRRSVFHIDSEYINRLLGTDNCTEDTMVTHIKTTQLIAKFLYDNNNDVVISVESPYRCLMESFKDQIGSNLVEIYIDTQSNSTNKISYSIEYEPPLKSNEFILLNTEGKSIDQIASKIIHQISKL